MAVSFEEFSVPPGSELALPPLFGGNILESELETEVEFVDGGLSGENLQDDEEEEAQQRIRELNKRKFLSLNQRCKEIEQVNERILNRLHQVQKIMRRLKQERRCLMKILDAYGDEYRRSHLTFLLEVKIEEDYLCDGGEELNLSWHPLSPRDKILQYTKFSSPGPCTDFD